MTGPRHRVPVDELYPNMRTNDAKALTYTTPPLKEAFTVVGHPILHLWLSTDAPDLAVFVYLEQVEGGNSTYITEGELRTSHRTLRLTPSNNFGTRVLEPAPILQILRDMNHLSYIEMPIA